MSSAASSAANLETMHLQSLGKLAKEASPGILEAGIPVGLNILSDIETALGKAEGVPEIEKLLASIKNVKAHTYPKRTIIGVVGTTGAGKSSVINAVLDEESLVPTNCMRACTAVITELRWNDAEDFSKRYRAEVQFISPEDWYKELKILFNDLSHVTVQELANSDGDAGIAYSKIRAVYPTLTKQDMLGGQVTPETLATDDSVGGILGTVLQFSASNSKKLLALIGEYIDSQDKFADGKPSAVRGYWPLVKVVRIYVKSPILATGLILVDLPGVQDSNAARSAVAAGYIQECTGLWVVVPITRAVDDQTAKSLMGDSFRRQLQLDGLYSAVTFICSKTDDLTIAEVMRVLLSDHPVFTLQQRLNELEEAAAQISGQMEGVAQRLSELDSEIEDTQRQLTVVEHAVYTADHDEDSILLVSPASSRKRAPRSAAVASRKKTRRDIVPRDPFLDDNDDGFDIPDISYSDDELIIDEPKPEIETLSKQNAIARRDALATANQAAREEKISLAKQQKALKKKLKAKRAEVRSLRSEIRGVCIQYRNEYSRPSIKGQFAGGLREIDQSAAAEHDEDEFDPSVEERDYEKISAELPVFCVSSRAYQKMSGRLETERVDNASGFIDIESTEIPALQRHAMETIGSARAAACRRFYDELRQYLSSLMMQVVIANQPLKLADDMRENELVFLKQALITLEDGLETAIKACMDTCRKKMRSRVFAKLESAANSASDQAVITVEAWGRRKDEGGLAFTTYRATCVRDGAFKGRNGQRDFNEELAGPIKDKISRKWENLFEKFIPEQLALLGDEAARHVATFIAAMAGREALTKSPTYKLVMGTVESLSHQIKDTSVFVLMVKDGSKAANRVFTPIVTGFMKEAYEVCLDESAHERAQQTHINEKRGAMFARVSGKARDLLDKMMDNVHKEAQTRAGGIVSRIKDDYTTLVVDKNIFKALKDVRERIKRILLAADSNFVKVYHNVEMASTAIEHPSGHNTNDSMEAEPPSPAAGAMISAFSEGQFMMRV
ncbi:hypothetical protein OQA88_10435 [Cercophora sp. LCS_1]